MLQGAHRMGRKRTSLSSAKEIFASSAVSAMPFIYEEYINGNMHVKQLAAVVKDHSVAAQAG
jgi:hypothetical protein